MRKAIALLIIAAAAFGAGCYDADKYIVGDGSDQVTADSILQLTPVVDTLLADGNKSLKLTAKIGVSALVTNRKIVFSCPSGHFIPSESSSVSIMPDLQGMASAYYVADSGKNTVTTITAAVDSYARTSTVYCIKGPATDFNLTANPAPMLADSLTFTTVSMSLDTALIPLQISASFTVTGGALLPSGSQGPVTIPSNNQGIATARVVAFSRQDSVWIDVVCLGVAKTIAVGLVPAEPQEIRLSPSKITFSLSKDTTIAVTAHLQRMSGRVTPGAHIAISAIDSTRATSVGHFWNVLPSASDGTVQANLSFPQTTYRGKIYLTAHSVEVPEVEVLDSIWLVD